jgi:hypothetical protein
MIETWIGVGIPTACYLFMASSLVFKHAYPAAMVFLGYAFANVGLMLRILK